MARMWRIVVLLLLSLPLGSPSLAQYPTRPVRLVVPASPGGASDLVARILAPSLSTELGQPFIVENRVTSGGTVASQQVAESTPDGHTLLVTFDTFAVNKLLFKELKWDPLRDFAPLMQVCRFPQVLVVHPSLGVKTVKEFVALAKVLAEPAVRERLEAQSCDIVGGTPEALADLVRAEQAKWGPIIRDKNITVD